MISTKMLIKAERFFIKARTLIREKNLISGTDRRGICSLHPAGM